MLCDFFGAGVWAAATVDINSAATTATTATGTSGRAHFRGCKYRADSLLALGELRAKTAPKNFTA